MGLISNGLGKGYGYDILKTFDLEKYFETTLFREDIRRAKPYPDPLIQALENLSRKVSEDDVVWYIGDRRKDVLAALAAGSYLPCPVQPFAYNLHAGFAILEHHISPEHIVLTFQDLEIKLRRIFDSKPGETSNP